jgi:hypothetical protein
MKKPEININFGPTAGLLSTAFFIAKITGYVKWSWWLVFAPLWAPPALLLSFMVVLGILAVATTRR